MVLNSKEFDKRITEKPYYSSWDNGRFIDYCKDEGIIDYDGLNDVNKLCLYVYAWNKAEILPCKRGILKKFGWTNYKLQKLIKESKLICTDYTISEHTRLLSGRGYLFFGE